MTDDFYRAFEDKHRGSRELIKSRLRVYLPFVEPIRAVHADCKAIDLGCGRGEWLELLNEAGFEAQGVDTDSGMLAACHELGLKVYMRDAIGFLKELPDASVAVVSGFHIAEHIPFIELQNLVQEALRVLLPAGLLILETPNPENVVVGSSNFYLDPTHHRPIPPPLLSFLSEYYGFARVKTVRLQEAPELTNEKAPSLLAVLSGVSPDYSIVSQKADKAEHMHLFDAEFEKNYGLNLEMLAQKYEDRIANAEATAAKAEATLERVRSIWLWRSLRWVNNKINDMTKRVRALVRIFRRQSVVGKVPPSLHDVVNSRSWHFTAPLRWLGTFARKNPVMSKIRGISKDPVGQLMLFVVRQPLLKKLGKQLLKPFPALKARLIGRKRAAQIRSSFKSLGMNMRGGEAHSANYQQKETRYSFSQFSPGAKQLTVDEILERIRVDLAEAQVEK